MARQWRQNELGGLALFAAGFMLISMSLGGLALGWGVDRVWHTDPWGKVIGLLAGTVIGFWDVYRVATRVMRAQPAPSPLPDEKSENCENSVDEAGDRD